MQITINGEDQQLDDARLTIAQLLQVKDVESPDMVSVQLNGEIVDRSRYDATEISDNDHVEFLYFMGGGTFA